MSWAVAARSGLGENAQQMLMSGGQQPFAQMVPDGQLAGSTPLGHKLSSTTATAERRRHLRTSCCTPSRNCRRPAEKSTQVSPESP